MQAVDKASGRVSDTQCKWVGKPTIVRVHAHALPASVGQARTRAGVRVSPDSGLTPWSFVFVGRKRVLPRRIFEEVLSASA